MSCFIDCNTVVGSPPSYRSCGRYYILTTPNNNKNNNTQNLDYYSCDKLYFNSNIIYSNTMAPNLNSDDYYQILGCDRNADDAQLKKAYRKLAVKVRTTCFLLLSNEPRVFRQQNLLKSNLTTDCFTVASR